MSVLRLVRLFENQVVPRDIPSCIAVTGRVDVRSLIAKYDAWSPFADDLPLPLAEVLPLQPPTSQRYTPAPTEHVTQLTIAPATAPATASTKVASPEVSCVLTVEIPKQSKDDVATPTLRSVPTATLIPTATPMFVATPIATPTCIDTTTLRPTQATRTAVPQPTARPRSSKTALSRLFSYENDPKYLKRRADAKLRRAAAAVKSSSSSWGL